MLDEPLDGQCLYDLWSVCTAEITAGQLSVFRHINMKTFALGCILLIAGVLRAACDEGDSMHHNMSTFEEPESIKLLYGESHGITWTDTAIKQRQTALLARKYLEVYSVDYHYKRGLIFYTGWGAVWRLKMEEAGEGAKGEQVVGDDEGACTLAVDWEHDRLYWTNPAQESVKRLDLDDSEADSVVIIENVGNLTNTNNLVVDPYMRYLFVATDSGYSLRTDLDGESRLRLNHGLWITNLALDFHNRRLYSCGSNDYSPVLQSSDYEGRNVVNYELQHGSNWWIRLVSLDVFSAAGHPLQLFWVHQGWREQDTAWRANITDGQLSWVQEYFVSGSFIDPENRIWCVKVCHPDVQTRPTYKDFAENPVPLSSESMPEANLTVVKSEASSFQLAYHHWVLTLCCLVSAMICRLELV